MPKRITDEQLCTRATVVSLIAIALVVFWAIFSGSARAERYSLVSTLDNTKICQDDGKTGWHEHYPKTWMRPDAPNHAMSYDPTPPIRYEPQGPTCQRCRKVDDGSWYCNRCIDFLADEHDDLERELTDLRDENDQLREEIERLKTHVLEE